MKKSLGHKYGKNILKNGVNKDNMCSGDQFVNKHVKTLSLSRLNIDISYHLKQNETRKIML